MHSFWIPALHGKVDLIPGHTILYVSKPANRAALPVNAPNTVARSTRACGLLVVAQLPDDYAAWLDQQRQPASVPVTADAIAGEQTFLSGPCIMCHQIRGKAAGGTVAPDLTHFASRQYIAANSYPKNDAYLEAWITHAQSLKPQAEVPDLTLFNGEQLRELVAYFRQPK